MEENERIYYETIAYIDDAETVNELDRLHDHGQDGMLIYVAEAYDPGNSVDPAQVQESPRMRAFDKIVAEANGYVVAQTSNDYAIYRKVTDKQVKEGILRDNNYSSYPEEVQALAREMIAEKFANIKRTTSLTMGNGDVLYFQYNAETDKIEAGHVTNAGLHPVYDRLYDHDFTLDHNLDALYTELSEMPEYQMAEGEDQDVDEDRSCGWRR